MKKGVLIVLVLVVAVAVFLIMKRNATESVNNSEPDGIVVLSFGGSFAEAQREAYFDPFTASTGIKVQDSPYNGEYGKLKAAVESGSVPWSVVDVEASALIRGIRDSIFQKIDLTKLQINGIVPEAVNDFGIGTDFYSVSLGWNTNSFPANGPQPSNWSDFWDVKKFPGPRAMKRDPRFTLEIALMADGVPPDQIYENGQLDVDRAFASLDRIKPYVTVWWTTGQQPIQLLETGEVVMAAAFGARLYIAKQAGSPIDVTWDNGMLDIEYWAILKGAPHYDAALKFIDFASQAEHQAVFPTLFPLGPVNVKAFDLIPKELALDLNTHPSNFSKQAILNVEFWADNEAAIRERFNSWLTQN